MTALPTRNQTTLADPLIIAHRGGSHEVPENTMASFRHAVSLGIRLVELDVQMTSDGELVVIHDDTVDRTTDGHGSVADFTLEEIKKLDAGSSFSPKHAGEQVPTLREVLDLCVENGVGVVVELKDPHLYPGMLEKVAAIIGEMWLRGAENIWCISFDHEAIRQMRKLDSTLPLGYLFLPEEYSPAGAQFATPDDTVQAFCPYYGTALRHPDQVARAHELGKFVFVYTVDDLEEAKTLASAGVDGMVTDEPSKMRDAFAG